MTVLADTNVLSELLRERPAKPVVDWFSAQPARDLFTSSVVQAEMLVGARTLPAGKRRDLLERQLDVLFGVRFAGRILPFDHRSAAQYANVLAMRRRVGQPISQLDAQVAATALAHGARLATRNVGDFVGCGLVVVDPWTHA